MQPLIGLRGRIEPSQEIGIGLGRHRHHGPVQQRILGRPARRPQDEIRTRHPQRRRRPVDQVPLSRRNAQVQGVAAWCVVGGWYAGLRW